MKLVKGRIASFTRLVSPTISHPAKDIKRRGDTDLDRMLTSFRQHGAADAELIWLDTPLRGCMIRLFIRTLRKFCNYMITAIICDSACVSRRQMNLNYIFHSAE